MFAKLQEEIAAETAKSLKSEGHVETTQDASEEKQDESLKNEKENIKEEQTMPNGEVAQDEDEGVDLGGKYIHFPSYNSYVTSAFEQKKFLYELL